MVTAPALTQYINLMGVSTLLFFAISQPLPIKKNQNTKLRVNVLKIEIITTNPLVTNLEQFGNANVENK